ncbi:ATPase AAA [Sorangium cellulosum]|uniref:ATPase AAA n=1 Tax=Sorangium cellulosum TaxID=56 RepID=A0A4P2QEU6_SORCE|nr:serine/threonine-protein kinase [Sorangium cellulosum]AUX27713.1 ATPase AAA [Sorangium cellulosum]
MSDLSDRSFRLITRSPDALGGAERRLYGLVAPLLDGTRTVRALVTELEQQADAAEIEALLRRLEALGHIAEARPEGPQRPPLAEATTATMASGTVTLLAERPRAPPSPTPPRSAPARDDEPMPERLGPYRVVGRLGSGGMGVVYEAVDEERGQRVALKTILGCAPDRLLRFKAEFRQLTRVVHPNLGTPYELMADGDTWFFTMELIDGTDFLSHIRGPEGTQADAPLGAAEEARLRAALRQLVQGVAALHEAGLLHLDLKPSNVLVDRRGRLVILDFGLARERDPDPFAPFLRASVQGTPSYIAPEQVLGQPPRTATDWYSVGMMLFEALTGQMAFEGASVAEILRARTLRDPPRCSALRPGLPPDLDELCARLCERDPLARPTAEALGRALGLAADPAGEPAEHAFLGRAAQLEALERAFERAAPGGPVLARVRGLSGIGKSAVVQRFLASARARRPVTVLSGRCYEWESLPYKGLDAAVDALCRALRGRPEAEQAALLQADGHEAAQLFPVLRALPGLDAAPRPTPPRELDPVEQRQAAFRALKRILARLGPVVLALDDLQWGDVDGARLLAELVARPDAPHLLVVVSYRDDEAAQSPFLRELAALREAGGMDVPEVEVELGPLDPEDARRLAAALLGPSAAPAEAAAIAAESGGSPFFVEQLARHALAARAGEAPRISLARVVEARLSTLPDEARRALSVIALAGRLPEQDLALTVARIDSDDRHGVLNLLRATSLIRTRGPRGTDAVEIYHDRLRACVVAELPPAERRALHGALAGALEAKGGVEPDTLAHHFHEAGDDARACGYAAEAAEAAFTALAFDRAAALYRSALAWGGARDGSTRLTLRLAESLFCAGRCAEAAGAYLDAAGSASGRERRDLHARAAQAYLAGTHLEEGTRVARPLLRELGIGYPGSPGRALASILYHLARLQLRGVDFTPRAADAIPPEQLLPIDLCWAFGSALGPVQVLVGFDFYLRSLLLALPLGEPRRIGRALAFLGASLAATGGGPFAARGEAYLRRAEALARELDDPYLLGITSVFRGLAEISGLGRWNLVLESAERGVRILNEQCTGVSAELDAGISLTLKALEQLGEIRDLGLRAATHVREASERGGAYAQVSSSYYVALLRLSEGDVDASRAHLRHSIGPWLRHGFTVQQYYAVRFEALCDLYEGRPERAAAQLERAWPEIERARLLQVSLCRIELFSLRAIIALSREREPFWRRARRLRACRRDADALAAERRVDGPPYAALVRAAIAAAGGERDHAAALLDESIAGFAAAGMHLCATCARRRKGELLGDRAQIGEADAWMAARGIRDPERWSRLYAPPFPAAI